MKSQVTSKGRLSTIDFVFSVMNSHRRPMDFTLLLHLKDAPGLEALRAGARSARNLYPATGSYIDKKHWVRFIEPGDGVAATSVSSTEELAKAVEAFLDCPLDLHRQMPVRQLVIMNCISAEMKLVTRFHHAVADGLSAAMWLSHQLRVALGKEAAVAEVAPFQNLPLRRHLSPVKKSRFAYRGPSHRLWTRHAQPSRARRWRTLEVAAADLREGCRRARGFTYNDLLTTCALEVFARWNRKHCNGHRQKVGLWLPVNIRQQSSAGFGNGSSRIRLYAKYSDRVSLIDKCREIRRQVFWSNRHGEWAVPQKSPLTSLPRWAMTPLLRCYLNRPGIDMATGVFSHAERWPEASGEVFQQLGKIESIGLLHTHYSVAINGATLGGRTWLTFTYDPALLSPGDIECLVEMYQEQLALAHREFE